MSCALDVWHFGGLKGTGDAGRSTNEGAVAWDAKLPSSALCTARGVGRAAGGAVAQCWRALTSAKLSTSPSKSPRASHVPFLVQNRKYFIVDILQYVNQIIACGLTIHGILNVIINVLLSST